MGFELIETEVASFNNLAEIQDYLKKEKETIVRVPAREFVDRQARFLDDAYYGRGKSYVQFNKPGFQDFCRILGIPLTVALSIQEKGLTTRVLNDALSQEAIQDRLRGWDMVINQETSTVLGMISSTYVGYSNETFLEQLFAAFPKIQSDYEVDLSFSINTKLYLRLLSKNIVAGRVHGPGGEGDDISRLGIEIRNSMIGDCAVSARFYVLRLICANGLVLPSRYERGTVYHTGREDTFQERLKRNVLPVIGKVRYTRDAIEKLGELPFDAARIVDTGGSKHVYAIVGLSREQNEERKKLRGKALREFDISVIESYPYRYGGYYSRRIFESRWRTNASMFDFINVFTEYAQKQPVPRRLQIEEEAGKLANWIYENRRRFL